MTKQITGTWFEFKHHSEAEGAPWNNILKNYTEADWRNLIADIKNKGMDHLVLLATALNNEAYFKTDIYPEASMNCKNPMEVLLSEADKQDMKVFISAGFYGDWHQAEHNMTSPDVTKRGFKAMDQICEQFGHHKSIYGWYFPDETCVNGYYSEDFIDYINRYSEHMHTLSGNYKSLIAPYGTNLLHADDKFVSQLEKIDCDFIAYQDEVGVQKSTENQTAAFYEALSKAHAKAGRGKLWADIEVFDFVGDVYNSALVPAKPERIQKQIDAISPFVERILCYEYQVYIPTLKK